MKWSHHDESVAAVMPRSRDTRFISSPHNNRKTASPFFREENRPRAAFTFAMDTSIYKGAVCPNCVSKEIVERGNSATRVCRKVLSGIMATL